MEEMGATHNALAKGKAAGNAGAVAEMTQAMGESGEQRLLIILNKVSISTTNILLLIDLRCSTKEANGYRM